MFFHIQGFQTAENSLGGDLYADTHTDEIFNVYGALDNLNKRMKSVENKVPDYTADMLEVYRNLGALTKRIAELEKVLAEQGKTA